MRSSDELQEWYVATFNEWASDRHILRQAYDFAYLCTTANILECFHLLKTSVSSHETEIIRAYALGAKESAWGNRIASDPYLLALVKVTEEKRHALPSS